MRFALTTTTTTTTTAAAALLSSSSSSGSPRRRFQQKRRHDLHSLGKREDNPMMMMMMKKINTTKMSAGRNTTFACCCSFARRHQSSDYCDDESRLLVTTTTTRRRRRRRRTNDNINNRSNSTNNSRFHRVSLLRAVLKNGDKKEDEDADKEQQIQQQRRVLTTEEENERTMFARTSSSLVSKTKSNSNTAARKEVPNIYGIPRDAVFAPLAGLLVSQLVLYIGVGVLLPALPLYAQSIGLSQSANGLVISAPALAMLILNVPTGQMADRYGRKPVMIAGLGIMAVADIGTALAKTMVFLIPTRLLLGVGRAACEGGDRAYLADLTKRVPEKRGIITAAQAMVHGFGLVIGPLIGGSALDEYGPATAFYVVGFAAVGTAIGYAFLPETLSESERSTDEDFFGSADDNDDGDANNAANNNGNTMPSFLKFLNLKNMTKRDKKSNLGKLLKDPDQRLLLTCAAANSFGFVAKLTVIPLFASGQLHATSLQVGELFSLTALLGLATAPVSGLLSDAIGKRWVLTGSLALCALGLAVGSGSEDLETLRLAVGCWGIGCAAAGPAVNALAQEIAPKGGEGESLTLPKTAADIVFLVGPIILGGANDLTDSQGAGILITAAIAGVASIVCAYGAVTYKKPPQRFG
jgi:MFS family permease